MDADYCQHEIRSFKKEAWQYAVGVSVSIWGMVWYFSAEISAGTERLFMALGCVLGLAFIEIGKAKAIPYQLRLIEIRNLRKPPRQASEAWDGWTSSTERESESK